MSDVATREPMSDVDHARECAAAIWLKWGFITRDEATNVISHFIAAAVESETAELRAELIAAHQHLAYLWEHTHSCPCGARLGSERTHPHVSGCPTAKAVEAMKGKSAGSSRRAEIITASCSPERASRQEFDFVGETAVRTGTQNT